MPWQQTDPVNERLKFVAAVQSGGGSMTELCVRFGISRKTGYKLLKRYAEEGLAGLRDRSRAPFRHPNQTPAELERAILRVRKAHPTWGSKKILAVLAREWTSAELPVRSTVDQVLRRAGVVTPRGRRRKRRPTGSAPVVEALAPNDVWSIDYKGWFRVGDGTRCDPLTVNDVYSRASLECRAMVSPKLEDVRNRLDRVFRDLGRPKVMLSDNGPPFGSRGIGGLSRLGVWLLKLEVQPVFIQPGHPEQNGRHERFHETLKAETANPHGRPCVRSSLRSIGSLPATTKSVPTKPSTCARPQICTSHRLGRCQHARPSFEYSDLFEVRRVRTDGTIKWEGEHVFVGEAMTGELIGIEPVGEVDWHVHVGSMRLGVLHETSRLVLPLAEDAGQ